MAQGLAAECPATVGSSGTTPLQVALEYKRLPVARRLQALRDVSKKKVTDIASEARAAAKGFSAAAATAAVASTTATAAPDVVHKPPAGLDASSRPAPRFPSWILASAEDGGLDVPELDGASADCEAQVIISGSTPGLDTDGHVAVATRSLPVAAPCSLRSLLPCSLPAACPLLPSGRYLLAVAALTSPSWGPPCVHRRRL